MQAGSSTNAIILRDDRLIWPIVGLVSMIAVVCALAWSSVGGEALARTPDRYIYISVLALLGISVMFTFALLFRPRTRVILESREVVIEVRSFGRRTQSRRIAMDQMIEVKVIEMRDYDESIRYGCAMMSRAGETIRFGEWQLRSRAQAQADRIAAILTATIPQTADHSRNTDPSAPTR